MLTNVTLIHRDYQTWWRVWNLSLTYDSGSNRRGVTKTTSRTKINIIDGFEVETFLWNINSPYMIHDYNFTIQGSTISKSVIDCLQIIVITSEF